MWGTWALTQGSLGGEGTWPFPDLQTGDSRHAGFGVALSMGTVALAYTCSLPFHLAALSVKSQHEAIQLASHALGSSGVLLTTHPSSPFLPPNLTVS